MKRSTWALVGLALLGVLGLALGLDSKSEPDAPDGRATPPSAAAPSAAPPTTEGARAGPTPNLAQRRGDPVVAIQQDPAEAARWGARLADPARGFDGRRVAADALAHAQTPAAQDALRTGLVAVVADPDLPPAAKALLTQRLGFVRDPDPASLDFAASLARSENETLRRAGLMSLGALARHSGDEARAMGAIDEALGDPNASTRAVGYRALGNLGSPTAVQRLQEAAANETNGAALAGIAQGLSGDPSARSTLALAKLAQTAHPATQLRALVGLSDRALSSESASELAAAGALETLYAENASAWVSAAGHHLAERPLRRAAERLARRGDVGPQVRARLRQLLEL